MRRIGLMFGATVVLVGVMATMAQAGGFRYPVGLTYASGPQKVMDKMKENYYVADDFVLPVGVAFNPYYEFDNGVGVGASFGPLIYMAVDAGGGSDFNMVIPIGADIRYTLFTKNNVSPYVRGGFRYPIAFGDYLQSKSAGLFGAVGVEFLRTKRVSMGIEISYDDSSIEVKSGSTGAKPFTKAQEVTPCGFMSGIYVVF